MNTNREVLQIALSDIIPNQFQPRMNFDEKELEELAASIKEHGIIQPLVLRKMGQKYEIIAGERRFRAAGMAGLTTVPAILSNIDDQASAEVALVENVQRKDLTAIEEARSYKNILDKGYLTQEQLAKKMGLSQPAIANKLRLLSLDEEVQQALLNGKISERHARSLLSIESKEKQRYWLNRIINERLTVRQLDVEIKKEQNPAPEDPLISITPNIENIKNNSQDITNNRFFNDPQAPITNEASPQPSSSEQKNQNKFFNFLEDEPVNLSTTTSNNDSIFNTTPPTMQTPANSMPTIDDNKFFNFDLPATPAPTAPTIEEPVVPQTPSVSQNDSELETLFDPMDQVELLDPDYEEKKKEAVGLDLKSAINQTRDTIENLKEKGFNIDVDEIDLDDKYQIVIKIEK